MALIVRDDAIIPFLIKKGALPYVTKKGAHTFKKHFGVKVDDNEETVHSAYDKSWFADNARCLKQLLLAGCPFSHMKKQEEAQSVLKDNCFLQAVIIGNVEAVNNFLKENSDLVKQYDELRATPLMYAAAQGYVDIVHILIAHGADKDAKNAQGEAIADIVAEIMTCCEESAYKNYSAIFKALNKSTTSMIPVSLVAAHLLLNTHHKN